MTNEQLDTLIEGLDLDEDNLKIIALMQELDEDYEEAKTLFDNEDYLVLTEEEAGERWDEYLENYIEDCILPELPESLQNYFDNESFIKDCKMDGRGHSLSSYDGNELEQVVVDTSYFIYRQN